MVLFPPAGSAFGDELHSGKTAPTVYLDLQWFGQTWDSVLSLGDEDGDNDESDGTSDIVDSSSVFEAFSTAFGSGMAFCRLSFPLAGRYAT